MISVQEVKRALDVVGSYAERMGKLSMDKVSSDLLDYRSGGMMSVMRQREWVYEETSRARGVIRQAQMERAWPMLGLLDIYRWPA